MSVTMRRRRLLAATLASVAVLAASTACAADSGGDTGATGKITLTVDLFGEQGFGYEKLYERYMRANPNVTIVERGKGMGLGDYNARLTQWIDSGRGSGDVVALEEGTIAQFKGKAGKFVNLLEHGAADLQGNFLPWKWEQALTADGQLLGLGTDVGSMAMCYRRDLFERAGLPADREQVSALWPTWDKFIRVGMQFAAREKSVKFVDAATNAFNTVLAQNAGANSGHTFFDTSDRLVIDENPDVKAAWDTTVAMIRADLSAGLESFSEQWTKGFKQARFATIGCPAWMTGVIKGNAGDAAAGKWDIAKAPGNGGNWGGSFLAVPRQGRHPAEAVKLIKFLTSPQAQIEAFNAVGALPSSTIALENPAVLTKKNAYFGNAPTGEIFAAGAKELKPVFLGSKNQSVRDAVEAALRSIEQRRRTPDQAWREAVRAAEAAAD